MLPDSTDSETKTKAKNLRYCKIATVSIAGIGIVGVTLYFVCTKCFVDEKEDDLLVMTHMDVIEKDNITPISYRRGNF